MSDMLEIETSKIAEQKGNADEKKFAEQMIADPHQNQFGIKGLDKQWRRQSRNSIRC